MTSIHPHEMLEGKKDTVFECGDFIPRLLAIVAELHPYHHGTSILVGKDNSQLTKAPASKVKETPRDPHSSSDFSNFEIESVHHTDKEIQADLDHISNLEESEFSSQGGAAEFQEIQAGIEFEGTAFAVQITPLKDTKKHREKTVAERWCDALLMADYICLAASAPYDLEYTKRESPAANEVSSSIGQDPARDTPASSYIPDYMMETLDNKNQTERLSTQRGTGGLPPETYSRMAEINSLEGMAQLTSRQITAADLELEKIRLESAMTRMRYRHEDNEKRRQHEEKMERMHHQAVSRSVNWTRAS
ncbi:UNVERIFIED_CONTAM: hypothetical protein K2H54_044224 [Gekko kuhli]